MPIIINSIDSAAKDLFSSLFAQIFPNKLNPIHLLSQPAYRTWIASCDQKPVGFILVQHIVDEVDIIDMGVLAAYRRQRIATLMLDQVISQLKAKQVKKIFLEVNVTNQPAIQLYKKFGFAEIAQRKGYYYIDSQVFHDACVMCLNLGNKPFSSS